MYITFQNKTGMFGINCFTVGLENRKPMDNAFCICYGKRVCKCCMMVSKGKECELNKTFS